METAARPSISVVIPVYNSEECLPELLQKLTEALTGISDDYEIILVNDCSPDNSWETMIALSDQYDCMKCINLRRNFGQDCAIMAGLHHATKQVITIMDDDLQHNPDDIVKLVEVLGNKYDVCYACFKNKKQSLFKNFGSWFNGKFAEITLGKPAHIYLSPFKVIRREVIEDMIKYDGPYPYIDGLIFRTTRNITQIELEHHARYMGEGNFTLLRSLSVWARVVTTFSVKPLRMAILLGLTSSGIGFIMALYFICKRLWGDEVIPYGWASTFVTILFLGGIQLMTLGVIGEYVGRTFIQNNREPQFIIREIRSGGGT
ncbi:MAG: glycosyltransferase family 2 protein [Planctomycetota bacterium]|jgi:undecaprenyl-phosphate 4-deoxy-4-formamido-L-arabinose transferase|nr:glycosyltransferase family 2 protein [Planctomycetota bacterium]